MASAPSRPLPMFPARLDQPCDVVASHAQAGPRYTSYPPATQFASTFGEADAVRELAAIGADEPLSLYAHVPYCSQLCWYCGCNVTISRDRSLGAIHVDRLEQELEILGRSLGGRHLVELALGGGSPNFLAPADVGRLLEAIARHFTVATDAELGIELDPRDTRAAQIDALVDLGFTRISVGVQDFTPAVQEAIHRIQSVEQTRAVIDRARARGVKSVNVDLVYGLPGQTTETATHTLREVVALAPDRIAVFGYAHMPHLRAHQKLVERAAPVPGIRQRVELLRTVMDILADAGYVRVGLDHFARPGDPLAVAMQEGRLGRNFQGYVVARAERLIGIGPSAISDSGHAYWQSLTDVDAWAAAVAAGRLPVARGIKLDADDELRRHVIMRLMCEGAIDFAEIEARTGTPFTTAFARELAVLEAEQRELVEVDRTHGRLVATPLGHHLIRNVAIVFDRYAVGRPSGSPTI